MKTNPFRILALFASVTLLVFGATLMAADKKDDNKT